MYILGILGSPRKNGNTDTLLEKALIGARSKGAKTEKIVLNDLKMVPCQECKDVKGDGTCKIEDDFQETFKKIKEADAVIFASPIFFGSLSAQSKILIDRFQCAWRYKYMTQKTEGRGQRTEKKTGALILVEASKRDDFLANAKSIIKNFFATASLNYKEELLCKGLDYKGAVLEQKELLDKAFELGIRITEKPRKPSM
ncbi:MAG: flavodoxin family protein [Candidatus Omnitrophica bacterium]|nr:flavodoxin family protein [Candidatus Omnitrophota bacterium]